MVVHLQKIFFFPIRPRLLFANLFGYVLHTVAYNTRDSRDVYKRNKKNKGTDYRNGVSCKSSSRRLKYLYSFVGENVFRESIPINKRSNYPLLSRFLSPIIAPNDDDKNPHRVSQSLIHLRSNVYLFLYLPIPPTQGALGPRLSGEFLFFLILFFSFFFSLEWPRFV